jgi:hypothetical protein
VRMWSHYDDEMCRVPGTFMAKRGPKKPKCGGYGARVAVRHPDVLDEVGSWVP